MAEKKGQDPVLKPSPNLHQRILAVMEEVGVIAKDKTNPHFGYKYAGIDTIVQQLNPLLIKHGLTVMYGVANVEQREVKQKIKAGWQENEVTHLSGWLRITNVDDLTEFVDIPSVGYGCDGQDKGAFKAHTGARKYALISAFNLATDDDPETSGTPPEATQSRTRTRSAEPPRQTSSPPGDKEVGIAIKYRKILMPEYTDSWPPQRAGTGKYEDQYFDIDIPDKFIHEPLTSGQRGFLLGKCSELGYSSDEERHSLFKAVYRMYHIPKDKWLIHTSGDHPERMTKAHAMFLSNALDHPKMISKPPNESSPFTKPKAKSEPVPPESEPDPVPDDVELDPDMDLEEDEDFFVDP